MSPGRVIVAARGCRPAGSGPTVGDMASATVVTDDTSPTDGAPPTPSGGRKVKSETTSVVDALDAATRNRGGVGLLVDSFPDDTRAAILRATARGVSYREIAKILSDGGYACSEGAVRVWVQRNG